MCNLASALWIPGAPSTFLFFIVVNFIYLSIYFYEASRQRSREGPCPRPRPCPVPSLSLLRFPPHALCPIALATPSKCLIQPLAQTWQRSVTSAAAEPPPRRAPGALTNRLVRPRRDISPMESGGVRGLSAGWNFFHLSFSLFCL